MEATALPVLKIVVDAKSKFGIKDRTTDKWLNPVKKELLESFVVGTEYDVEIVENKGKDGKVYNNISKIVATGAVAPAPAKKQFNSKFGGKNYLTKEERLAEAKGKSLHGFIVAALQSPKVTMFNDNKALFAWIDQVCDYGMTKLGFKD